ncbi:glycosyltransferase [Natronomonas salina]|uniref:glycosyltransferase n=1 Tax=Natronomonas salina TaxID=1710540 RepID=UPI0015B4046D|nr:glycosyltransferase [Natronomonas salina]QLD89879.1 glycosyltransferase [Natronomonas salina]
MTAPETRVVSARPAAPVDLSVLSLVTTPEVASYADQLRALSELGVETTVLSATGDGDGDCPKSRSDGDARRLAAGVVDRPLGEYDLLHANHGRTGAAALAQTDLPVVLSLWASERRAGDGVSSRHAASRADAVVVPSEAMGQALDRDYEVIPRGVDLDRVRPQPPGEARAAVGWDDDARHVVQPALSSEGRGVHDLTAEAVEAAERRLGEPVDLHTLDRRVPYGERAIYLSAADAMVLPSRSERSSTAAAEAMACNLPVVATDDCDVAGRLAAVEPSPVCGSASAVPGALVEVLRRGERSTGRAYARELHTERTAWRVLGVYRDVLDLDSA